MLVYATFIKYKDVNQIYSLDRLCKKMWEINIYIYKLLFLLYYIFNKTDFYLGDGIVEIIIVC